MFQALINLQNYYVKERTVKNLKAKKCPKKIYLAAAIDNGNYSPEHGYINLVLLNLVFNF
ncbi:MAG: hypothetical protein CMC86_03125 [Flavobacteriaceae bacterium]|nr:hypothetical protein [Flavobacteriaceae bacterium]